jgi:hypothetical protein
LVVQLLFQVGNFFAQSDDFRRIVRLGGMAWTKIGAIDHVFGKVDAGQHAGFTGRCVLIALGIGIGDFVKTFTLGAKPASTEGSPFAIEQGGSLILQIVANAISILIGGQKSYDKHDSKKADKKEEWAIHGK